MREGFVKKRENKWIVWEAQALYPFRAFLCTKRLVCKKSKEEENHIRFGDEVTLCLKKTSGKKKKEKLRSMCVEKMNFSQSVSWVFFSCVYFIECNVYFLDESLSCHLILFFYPFSWDFSSRMFSCPLLQ